MADQTSNEQLRDAMVRHQVGLTRVSASLARRAQDLLNATEADLSALIKRRVERLVGTDLTTTASIERLKALDEELRKLRLEAHGEVYSLFREELREVALHEPLFTAAAIQATAPVILEMLAVQPSYLKTLVDTHPFEGRVLKDWADRIAQADVDRMTAQIRIGLLQGETAQQIAARVIGSAALRGADGVTEIARRDAMALSRTAVNAFANEARRAFSEANADIAETELYLATLDGATTPICRSLDGNIYPVGEGPRPPMHFQCRSLRVLLLDGRVLGTRPLKASTEQQLVREYRRGNGLEPGTNSRKALPHGHKGSFDEFARRRVRELTGTTPASTTYQQFLTRQSAEFQDDVLGKTKGLLFRQGGLTLDKFVDRQGRELTLAELARSERAAFERAGLDPARWG